MILDPSFYAINDVVKVARGLLGKFLFTRVRGVVTAGMIVETEAYSHTEKGCHAFQNRMTERNRVMFREGGYAYVYLCYGIHNLFNVVTGPEGQGDAVLIRALEPAEGIKQMLRRTKAGSLNRITSGPGKLTKAMGIDRKMNGELLWSKNLWIEENTQFSSLPITAGTRIGIDYAGKDALLPWRFCLKDNLWVSK